jgi:hypothetical protein
MLCASCGGPVRSIRFELHEADQVPERGIPSGWRKRTEYPQKLSSVVTGGKKVVRPERSLAHDRKHRGRNAQVADHADDGSGAKV